MGNNSLVFLEDLGENSTQSLHCTTPRQDCCSGDELELGWFYPNGTKITYLDELNHSLYSTAGEGVLILSYSKETLVPAGIYKCVVPTGSNSGTALSRYYIGLYQEGNGKLKLTFK